MRKVCDWVFGSFFRTIGRVMVFILIGIIVSYLVDFGSLIDGFSITNLFLEKVSASSTDVGFVKDVQIFNSNQVYSSVAGNPLCTSGQSSTPPCSFNQQYNFDINYTHNTGNNQFLVFRFSYIIAADGSADDSIVQFSPSATIANTSGASYNCQIENGLIICPVSNNQTYNRLNIRGTVYYNLLTNNIRWQIDNWAQVFKNILYQGQIDTATAIQNQTQQQQQQHNETQSYLEDTNTTESNSQGQDFINNFDNNTHGLTGIITAPLNAIQSLASATCTNLVLPLPFTNNKTLNLPCMSTIYTNHFGVFYTMYQGIILALISYWVCVRLFTLVKGFKDPDDDKIEVMDL